MAETVVKQSEAAGWLQENGPGTAFKVYAVGEDGLGLTGKSIPIIGLGPVYARDRNGKPLTISVNETAPGDLPTLTMTMFEKAQLTVMNRLLERKCPINLQIRFVECGVIDNPFLWDKIEHWSRGQVTTLNPGDGPALEFDGSQMQSSAAVSFREVVTIVRVALSTLTVGSEVNDGLDIAGLPEEDCNECGTGYPGADEILVIGAEPTAVATPKVWVSGNGGGVWNTTTTDPLAADEAAAFVAVRLMGENDVRIIVGNSITDASAEAKIAYADVTFGDLLPTVWTDTLFIGGSTGDLVTAMIWPRHDRLYVATDAFEIYVDEQQGEDGTAAAIYAGAVVINAFGVSPDGADVWAVGATNFIAREKNQSDTFEVKNGPTGGGDFTAIAVADDGTIVAGNAQYIYTTQDNGEEAGNWVQVKDLGTGFTAVALQFIKGDSQLIRAVSTDASIGHVWESFDGGSTWQRLTIQTNLGYSAAYFSEIKANEAVIVGPADAGPNLVAQQLSPSL